MDVLTILITLFFSTSIVINTRTLTLESDFNKRVSTLLAQYKIDLLGKPTEIEFDKEVYKHRESWISEAVRAKEEFNDMSAQEVTLLWQRIATWIY